MVNIKKGLYGALFIILATATTFFIALQGSNVSMKITPTSSTFYVNESGHMNVAGVENVYLYNESKKLSVLYKSPISSELENDSIVVTKYKSYDVYGPPIIVIETYKYNPNSTNIESFPISHTIQVLNGKGLTLQYEVSKLSYDGSSRNAFSPERFGNNMKVEWQEGAFYAKLSKLLTGGKLVVKYKIDTNYTQYNVRLFDPSYIINGDNVYINTSKAYINANPHTMSSSGFVNIDLQSKNLSSKILLRHNS